MRPASRICLRLPAALAIAVLLAAPGIQAAPPTSALASAPGPSHSGAPAPRASADSKRMYAVTLTNLVVYENGAGYIHAFWRTLGTAGPDSPARLQWGRGCPEVSDRTFTALTSAFSHPDRFILIVDRSPDPRQANAYCVTNVELERIQPPQDPPPRSAPISDPASPSDPPPLLKK